MRNNYLEVKKSRIFNKISAFFKHLFKKDKSDVNTNFESPKNVNSPRSIIEELRRRKFK